MATNDEIAALERGLQRQREQDVRRRERRQLLLSLQETERALINRLPRRYTHSAKLIVSKDEIQKCRYQLDNQLAVHLLAIQKLLNEDDVIAIHSVESIRSLVSSLRPRIGTPRFTQGGF